MKIRITAFISAVLACQNLAGQNQPASLQDNYAGILALPSQPGNIADNRYKIDINLVSTTNSFYNNYIALKGHTIGWWSSQTPWADYVSPDGAPNAFQDPGFQSKYLFERLNGNNKSVHGYDDVMGPSVLYTIDNKQAISVVWRVRSIVNIDGIGEDLARVIYHDKDVPEIYNEFIENPHLGMANMTWAEYSFGYGRVLYDEHKHFLKAGVNLKLVQGMHAMYTQFEPFDYEINDSVTISIPTARVNYGRSERYDPSDPGEHFSYNFDSKMSPAFDFGIIYEFRPNREKFKYDMDGEYDKWMNDKNKYKLKVGMSLTDLGRLKFNKKKGSGDFIIDTLNWNTSELNIGSFDDFDSVLATVSSPAPGDERTFKMQLPLALSFQIDYNIWNNFYVNLTPYWALYNGDNPTKVHNISSYSITPRYEHKWFGFSVPFSYNHYGNTAIGMFLRLGPLTVGTTNFGPYFYPADIFGIDGYFALKVPIFRSGKPSDKDGDKVSDKKDDCREIPGLLAFKGCPDIDNDGIPDIFDECPSDSGMAEFKGCPDTDGDGIIDKFDECLDLPGILAFKGCPDTDGDSLIDPQDSCPTLAGLLVFTGCPDTDGDSIIDPDDLCPEHPGPLVNGGCPDRDVDGIFDYLDECPEKAGPKENNGCPWPDTDLDGILDKDDRCPNNVGPRENGGCPYTDTDGDSILDKDDACPNVPGVIENNGCPKIEEEALVIINTAFANLEFVSGKDVIRDESFSSLDELAGLLVKKVDWKLKLSGHTDNVGAEKENLILSKRRAEAVQTFLAGKGVEKERVKVEFYGETKPIDSNDTPEGRQRNRRVEMEILFE